MTEPRDCLVIGGGPAGLTAAIYLARFHLSVTVIDAGQSRARLIPLTRNHAGFPEGISGADLLDRMCQQAVRYGSEMRSGIIDTLELEGGRFLVTGQDSAFCARTVLLATGVVNRPPLGMKADDHAAALADGRLRYCPICDGYEVTDQRVAVIGEGEHGYKEALFLRAFTADVTLVSPGHDARFSQQRASLISAGIHIAGSCNAIRLTHDKIELELEQGPRTFDSLYPALGSTIRSELAVMLGAECSDEGCLTVDSHQRTSVRGLYAAGDVVLGLDQISHAMGEGGVAATTIRNDLAQRTPLLR